MVDRLGGHLGQKLILMSWLIASVQLLGGCDGSRDIGAVGQIRLISEVVVSQDAGLGCEFGCHRLVHEAEVSTDTRLLLDVWLRLRRDRTFGCTFRHALSRGSWSRRRRSGWRRARLRRRSRWPRARLRRRLRTCDRLQAGQQPGLDLGLETLGLLLGLPTLRPIARIILGWGVRLRSRLGRRLNWRSVVHRRQLGGQASAASTLIGSTAISLAHLGGGGKYAGNLALGGPTRSWRGRRPLPGHHTSPTREWYSTTLWYVFSHYR